MASGDVAARRDALLVTTVVLAGLALIAAVVAVGLNMRKSDTSGSHEAAVQTGAVAGPPAGAVGPVEIRLSEFNVDMPATLTPGLKTLHITNGGTVQHELLVFRSDLAPAAYPIDHGDINEDGPGITKVSDGDNIDPGKDQTRTVDLSQPGQYLFVCNLPGHFHSGMFKQVTVGATPDAVTVGLTEFKITPGATELPKGPVTFTITNSGATQHELLVFHTDLTPDRFPLDPDGTIQEDAAGMNKVSDGDNIDPGKGQTRSVDLSQPGTYVLVCNLPGHFKAGMYTTITVR